MYDFSSRVGCEVLCGEHVVNARPGRRLENAFCKCISNAARSLISSALFVANLNVPGTVKNINRPLYLLPVAGTH
jgi:hypothetical protein